MSAVIAVKLFFNGQLMNKNFMTVKMNSKCNGHNGSGRKRKVTAQWSDSKAGVLV